MNFSQLRAAALHVLTEHIGVAAEFVIDDVTASLETDLTLRDNPVMLLRQFFFRLDGELPPELNRSAIQLEIMQRARRAT